MSTLPAVIAKQKYAYNHGFTVIKGKKYFVGGHVRFPAPTPLEKHNAKIDRTYVTRGGPCASHNGVILKSNTINLQEGVKRLTKCRDPDHPGTERMYRAAQTEFIATRPWLKHLLRKNYARYFDTYTNAVDEAADHHADPHAKRIPRINAFNDVINYGLVFNKIWNLPKKGPEYQCKRAEYAKPGKTVRCIADMHTPASLQGFRLTAVLKQAMFEEPLYIHGGCIMFCKAPSTEALRHVFRELISPSGTFFFVYFSDDACLALRLPDGTVLRMNLDITSCDASHTKSLFDFYVKIHPKRVRGDAAALVAQCEQPITITDPNAPRGPNKRQVILKPREPRLYSGATPTTDINCLACILMAISIIEGVATVKSGADVVRLCAMAGYLVSSLDCSDWHQLQFLKHSPVIDLNGDIQPILNLGVLLRLSGTAKGDFPGSKNEPMKVRVDRFQAALLQGAYPYISFPLIDRLKANCATNAATHRGVEPLVTKMLAYRVVETDDHTLIRVSSAEVYQRYSLTPHEVVELDDGFGACGYMDHYASTGTDKIFNLDYGLNAKYLLEPPLEWGQEQQDLL